MSKGVDCCKELVKLATHLPVKHILESIRENITLQVLSDLERDLAGIIRVFMTALINALLGASPKNYD